MGKTRLQLPFDTAVTVVKTTGPTILLLLCMYSLPPKGLHEAVA
jgi:hypothetical protein